ncbi:MAG: hypothetical protein K0R25_898 [Rickettsiaceae bacterium]|jgi:hypothetical protein|nr:hypothetical protein [Rickettsiaceae bacterium]
MKFLSHAAERMDSEYGSLYPAFFKSIGQDDLKIFRKIISPENYKQACEEYLEHTRSRLLSDVAAFGAVKIIEYLINECGANIREGSNEALRRAAENKEIETTELFLDKIDPTECPRFVLLALRSAMGGMLRIREIRPEELKKTLNFSLFLVAKYGSASDVEWITSEAQHKATHEEILRENQYMFSFAIERDSIPVLLYLCALLPENEREQKLLELRNQYSVESEEKDDSPNKTQPNSSTIRFLHHSDALAAANVASALVELCAKFELSAIRVISLGCKEKREMDIANMHQILTDHISRDGAFIVNEYLGFDPEIMDIKDRFAKAGAREILLIENFNKLEKMLGPIIAKEGLRVASVVRLSDENSKQFSSR